MTPDIKELAKQAGAVINTSVNWPDVIAFGNDTLAEFTRLIRAEDEKLMRQALDALNRTPNGDFHADSNAGRELLTALRARLEGGV